MTLNAGYSNIIIAAITNPRMVIVSGIASNMITMPAISGFSAIVPVPPAPILDCAQPVATAPPKNAIAAPIGFAHSSTIHTTSKLSS
jgi:hypothetical protein